MTLLSRMTNRTRLVIGALLTGLAVFGACGGHVTVDASSGAGGAASAGNATGSAATGATSTGSGGSLTSCAQPGSCSLVAKTCCGVCGKPALGDVIAIATGQESAYRSQVCGADGGPCPACAEMPNPQLFPVCDVGAGSCVAVDVGTSSFSECTVADDCTLRLGLGCCSCGVAGDWVAVAKAQLGALANAVCGPSQACPDCEPVPPPGYAAICNAGHCSVVAPD